MELNPLIATFLTLTFLSSTLASVAFSFVGKTWGRIATIISTVIVILIGGTVSLLAVNPYAFAVGVIPILISLSALVNSFKEYVKLPRLYYR